MITSSSIAAPGQGCGRFAKSFDASSISSRRKKSERTDWCKQESGNVVKGLSHRFSRRAKAGWSPERRARQAALTRHLAPWQHSTGPKTEAGKERCSRNALRHGGRSRARILELQRIRRILRKVDENIRAVRLFIPFAMTVRASNTSLSRWLSKPKGLGRACRAEAHRSGRLPWREPGTRAMLRKIRSGGETCVLWQL